MDSKEFENYTNQYKNFSGNLNMMANSIELLLDGIFENLKINIPQLLGNKIKRLVKNKVLIDYDLGNLNNLIRNLNEFNEVWVIFKHGTLVGGVKELTIHKNNNFFIFNNVKLSKICDKFSETIAILSIIFNRTKSRTPKENKFTMGQGIN